MGQLFTSPGMFNRGSPLTPDRTGTDSASGNNGASTLTFAHTTTADTGILIVLVANRRGGGGALNNASVTFDGVAMTQWVTSANQAAGANRLRAEVFYLLNPGAKTANVVVTPPANSDACHGRAINFKDSNTSPLYVTGTANSGAGTATALVATADIGVGYKAMIGIGAWGHASAQPFTPDAGTTELSDGTQSTLSYTTFIRRIVGSDSGVKSVGTTATGASANSECVMAIGVIDGS